MIGVENCERVKLEAILHESWRLSSRKLTIRGDQFNPQSFGYRLKAAFGHAKNAEIARQLGVSESAVSNYVGGRVPDAETLVQIKNLTNCNLDWLLTGEGDGLAKPPEPPDLMNLLDDRIRQIIREEQQNIVGPFEKADIMLARNLGTVGDDEAEEKKRKKN